MKASLALAIILLGFGLISHCGSKTVTAYSNKQGAAQSSAKMPATLVVNKDVVLLFGPVADLELLNMPRPTKEDEEFCYACTYHLPGLRHIPILSISGSGLGTYMGTQYPPLHFASIIDKASGKTMKWYLQLASSKGFINRSAIGWGGDYIPGVRAAARMYDRQLSEGNHDRMTAEVQLMLPGQAEVGFIFVGYDSEGKRILPFGRKPFVEHISELKPKN
jgi:hypothetical protein